MNAYLVSFSSTGDVKVSSTPRFSLVGHADNVCTLGVFGSEYIVSGSWDATVRVWKNWECVATLVGPSLAVWSVLPLDSQHLLAASADKSVSLWSLDAPSAPVASFTGATQAVRGLAQLSPTSFASCGNDGAIRVYPLGTDAKEVAPQATLHGHASFVYSLAALGETLVSSGEDRAVCVWKNGALQQMLTLPAISVWCVCALPGGDIACGTSDGQVRLFSAARPASDELVAAYEATVATQALADAEVDASTPRGERTLLDAPGRAEGATVVVRDGSVAEVHRWSQHASSWKKVGVVTDAAASQQKKMLDGKAYDYVFDVDVEDGAPPLKLGYNANESPYDAANRFLGKYQLPATYLDQVVQFLEKNTQAVGLSAPTASDPYTGSSSYTPQPTQAAPAPPLDPFTGAGGITSASRTLRVLPQEQYLAFLQTNLDAARAKIRELAGGDAPLSDEDAARLDRLVDALRAKASADVSVLSTLLSQWPPAKRFPLLDLLRIVAAQPSTAPFSALATEALVGAEWDALDHYQGERKHAETNAMLALRVLANGFVAPGGPQALNDMALEALATLQQPPWAMLNKNARIALATIALKYVPVLTQLFCTRGALVVCAHRAASLAHHRAPAQRRRERDGLPRAGSPWQCGTCIY